MERIEVILRSDGALLSADARAFRYTQVHGDSDRITEGVDDLSGNIVVSQSPSTQLAGALFVGYTLNGDVRGVPYNASGAFAVPSQICVPLSKEE